MCYLNDRFSKIRKQNCVYDDKGLSVTVGDDRMGIYDGQKWSEMVGFCMKLEKRYQV